MSAVADLDWAEIDMLERDLVALMAELRDYPAEDRHAELVSWIRSDLWHTAFLLLTGWQGELARDAYRALKRDLTADSPGKRWDSLAPSVGRASIIRLLGLTDVEAAYYAALPFRTWVDDDERTWIAGAIGCPPILNAESAKRWLHLDITDVILWCPRTNEARIAGEHASTSAFVIPSIPEPRLTIWGDCGAYFRAWASRRARTGQLAQQRARGAWAHPIVEPTDGNLPGGLLVGNYLRAPWPNVETAQIIAGAGITAAELHHAAVRAARLPQFGTA